MPSTTDGRPGSGLLDGWPLTALRALLADRSETDDGPLRALAFWFALPDGARDADRELPRRWWFEPSDSLDAALIALFSTDVGQARRGGFDDRFGDPRAALGGIILIHALPARLWRGSERAATGTPRACALAMDLIRTGADRSLSPLERAVACAPLLDSPDPVDAERALALYEGLGFAFWIRRAEQRLTRLTGANPGEPDRPNRPEPHPAPVAD